jgi:transposase
MELTAAVRVLLQETAQAFYGARRRRFLAETVEAFGLSQRQAERQLGWSRDTIRKAQHERHSGLTCVDNFSARGRKPAEFHLPHLVPDLCDLVRDQLQTDPTFQTTGLYCRLSAAEVRKQLIERKGYTDENLPSVQTIGAKLNLLGFRLRTVVKSRPQKE